MEINTYYNEDCLDTMKKMPDNFIDLVITSPPYDDLRTYDGYSFDFQNIAKSLYRILKEGGVIVWIISDQTKDCNESGTSFRQVLYFKEIGFNLFDTMIWHKNNNMGPKNRYYEHFEYMFILSKNKPKTINLIQDRINKKEDKKHYHQRRQVDGSLETNKQNNWIVGRYGKRGNIWYYPIGYMSKTSEKIAYEHPAIFPEKLVRDHIISWSNEGDLVYDPFSGSGTTLIVARDFKRNYVGSEISSKYCEIIEQRLNPEQTRLFE